MKKYLIKLIMVSLLVLMPGGLWTSGAEALTFTMQEDSFNSDGSIGSFATPHDFSSVSWSTSFNTPGTHFYITFVDPEIDQLVNGFSNEYGDAHGTLAAGQSWEIDEPGYVFGDIYNNFVAGSPDNFNGVPSSAPDDVSMALGWNFSLLSGETASLNFFLQETAPSSGFYLSHTDPDSNATLYFFSKLDIRGGVTPIPEPGTVVLLGSGIAGLFFFGKKKLLNK